jgi:Escherichia/Staphylococcus phage prohead protease
MELIKKAFPFELKAADDHGIVEAIVSVTNNVDRVGDRIMPGFFEKSLRKKLPRAVWAHRWDEPIGKTLVAEEWRAGDPRLPEQLRSLGGYYVKGQLILETQRGREAYALLKAGAIDEFSIGFSITADRYDREKKTRELLEGEWFEWSPVLVGANPATTIISVKSDSPLALDQARSDYARHQALLAEIELLLL